MKRVLQTVVVVLMCTAVAAACNIPVFRFALERWKPDACEVIVFHEGSLSEEHEEVVMRWEEASVSKRAAANLHVIRCDLRTRHDTELKELWLSAQVQTEAALPFVVVRSLKGQKIVNHWHSSISQLQLSGLLDSPVRRELVKRLQNGDAIVWLVLKSKDKTKNAAVADLLEGACRSLPSRLELPEGIGLPGSELYSEVPLLLQFSVLSIDPVDPKERYLVRQMSGFQSAAAAEDEPLIMPVFGRGRALEVIPASELNIGLVSELTEFLCGACSCQVKEQNPGFDLLLSTNWSQALFGEEAEQPPAESAAGAGRQKTPQLLPIPPGRSRP